MPKQPQAQPKATSNHSQSAAATPAHNKPAATIRQGNLKCVIWRNQGDKGPWYSADLVRTFKTEAGFQDTHSVPADDLLRVGFLAQQAFAQLQELKAADKAAAADGEEPDEPAPY